MIKSKLIIIVFTIVITGCAITYKELKQSQPLVSQTVDGSAKTISSCVYLYLKERGNSDFAHERFYDELNKKWYITTDYINWIRGRSDFYLNLIDFEQQDDTVLINIRAIHQNYTEKPTQAINHCS